MITGTANKISNNGNEVLLKGLFLPGAPFQKALKPSSLYIFSAQSVNPVYVVWPVLATTCSRVLITSAGVANAAAGAPVT